MDSTNLELFKNALVYTVTINAVNRIVDHREGSIITMFVTAALATYGCSLVASVMKKNAESDDASTLVRPIYAASAFITSTFVSVGVNMQSNLAATLLTNMFDNEVNPFFVVASSVVGLVLLWVLGVAIGAWR